MRTSSRPSSKKCSSPSYHSVKSLPKVENDELVFKSFYPVSSKPANEDFFDNSVTGVFDVGLMRWHFRKWRDYDRLLRPNCCLKEELVNKCSSCSAYHESQQKLIRFATKRVYEKLRKLISPHLTLRKLYKESLIFSSSKTQREPTELEDFLQRSVMYMQIWADKNDFGVHSNLGLYCLFMAYEQIVSLGKEHKICLTHHNIFNIVATGMVVSCKYSADEIIKNDWWSKVVDIDSVLLNKMEKAYFGLLDFTVHVSESNLVKLYKETVPNLNSIVEEINKNMPESDELF